MNITDTFLNHNHLKDADDLDSLLELADLVRTLIQNNLHAEISRVLLYIVENSCHEAFAWCMSLLQEALENPESGFSGFEFGIGLSVPDYDDLIERLEVDLHAPENGVETVCDRNGEVESFFNILVYKTRYKNILFVSSENFDTKDNDYVQYKLLFQKSSLQ